jgi:hypothetical protein
METFVARPKVVQSIETICNEYASTLKGNKVGDLKQRVNKMTTINEKLTQRNQHLSETYTKCKEELETTKRHYYAMEERLREFNSIKSARDELQKDVTQLLTKQAVLVSNVRKETEETCTNKIKQLENELFSEQARHKKYLVTRLQERYDENIRKNTRIVEENNKMKEMLKTKTSVKRGQEMESTIIEKLFGLLPCCTIENTAKIAHSMDISVEFPETITACKIGIESKNYARNVPAKEIAKFENDLQKYDGGILMARMKVDVTNGFSVKLMDNLFKVNNTTYDVNNQDFRALLVAIMLIVRNFDSANIHSTCEGEDVVANINTLFDQIVHYNQYNLDFITDVKKKSLDHEGNYDIQSASFVECVNKLRTMYDGVKSEKMIQMIKSGSNKRKRSRSGRSSTAPKRRKKSG